MIAKPWISIGGSCLAIAVNSSPVFTQLQRYPTETELHQLRQEFQQNLSELEATGIYTDRRTAAERETRAALVNAWAEIDPAIAPFLGEWVGFEESLYIYPASNQGNVCILDIFLDGGEFYTGQVRDGNVYTTSNQVLFLNSYFLNTAFIFDNQPSIYQYANSRPLPDSLEQLEEYYPETIAAFHAADCLADLADAT